MDIYLDNAATTYPKPECVYRGIDHTLRHLGVSPGRGSYRLSLEAGRLVLGVRETVAEFFGIADASRVVFTANATEAINIALFGLLRPGDRVVTSTMEHNAVSRPLHALANRGVEVVRVQADYIGQVSPADIRDAASVPGRKTRMVVLSHCSNVTGTIQPIEEIGPWCRREGILFLVDAAQSAGLLPIDVQDMSIDLTAWYGIALCRAGIAARPLDLRRNRRQFPLAVDAGRVAGTPGKRHSQHLRAGGPAGGYRLHSPTGPGTDP
jgi:selenocysteine lyase/cysteine desulfurase